MTEPHKPAAHKPAAKKPAPKTKPTSVGRKPVIVPQVVKTVKAVPNLTYRLGQTFLDWWRNR
jgi:hypothetical protein